MLTLFGVLIILSSLILGLIVLIQNPKGGGLSGTFGGFGNQVLGVQQTNDILEKGTWIFAAAVGILCLISPAFINSEKTVDPLSGASSKGNTPAKQAAPAPAPAPAPAAASGTATMPGTTSNP